MALIATLRACLHRRRYDRYMQNERRKIDALAMSTSWICDRCGTEQTSEGREVRKYWEGSNYSEGWPRADFVAMSCWECGAPITKSVAR